MVASNNFICFDMVVGFISAVVIVVAKIIIINYMD